MCYVWSTVSYGAETWILRKVDQKYLESSEMWCWGRVEIIWTERVNNEVVLHTVKEGSNMIRTMYRRIFKWMGYAVRMNCLLNTLLKER